MREVDGGTEEERAADKVNPGGPDAWANWHAALSGMPSLGAYEALLSTDAHVTGEALHGIGPYRLFNTLGALGTHGGPRPGAGVALRVEHHLPHVLPSPADHRPPPPITTSARRRCRTSSRACCP